MKVDTIILCGGFGKRLRPLFPNTPKVLVNIGDKTFIDILIDNLISQGINSIILATGYKKEMIREHFSNSDYHKKCDIIFSEEEEPLGTGGSIKNAEQLIKSDPFIVMNGDSYIDINFRDLLNFHKKNNALISMVLSRLLASSPLASQDFGMVRLDKSGQIESFREKPIGGKESFINAGIYIMNKDVLNFMKVSSFDLERDLFPMLCERFYGFETNKQLIDIGTPERYNKAIENSNLIKNHTII